MLIKLTTDLFLINRLVHPISGCKQDFVTSFLRFQNKINRRKIWHNQICLHYGTTTTIYRHFLISMFCQFPFAIYCYIMIIGPSAFCLFLLFTCLKLYLPLSDMIFFANGTEKTNIKISKQLLLIILKITFLWYALVFSVIINIQYFLYGCFLSTSRLYPCFEITSISITWIQKETIKCNLNNSLILFFD